MISVVGIIWYCSHITYSSDGMKKARNVIAVRNKARPKQSGGACEYLGATPFVLAQLVEMGRVKLTRPEGGGRPYFAREDLDAYLATSASHLP